MTNSVDAVLPAHRYRSSGSDRSPRTDRLSPYVGVGYELAPKIGKHPHTLGRTDTQWVQIGNTHRDSTLDAETVQPRYRIAR